MENHLIYEALPRKTRERQPPSQRWIGEGDERRVVCALLFVLGDGVLKLEVLKVREESDEI